MKKLIITILIFCLFLNPLLAGNMNVKLEKIYSADNKIIVSYNEGKQSMVLVLPKNVSGDVVLPPKINISKLYKVGNTYPASPYIDKINTKIYLYDDNGKPHVFIDDTAARKYAQAKAQQAKAAALAAANAPAPDTSVDAPFIIVLVILSGVAIWALGNLFAAMAM